MANVNWIKGEITPPEDGEYYVILEAMQDSDPRPSGEALIHKGDIDITDDWYDADLGWFQHIGKDNPYWKVLAWAEVFKPPIPEEIRDRVRWYFGKEINHG